MKDDLSLRVEPLLNQSDERKGLVEQLREATRYERSVSTYARLCRQAADLLERDSIQLRECGEEVVKKSIATKQSTDATGNSATEFAFSYGPKDESRDEIQSRFDNLSEQIETYRTQTEQRYYAWCGSAAALKMVEDQRNIVWKKLMGTISNPPSEGAK